jgi:Tol biopolymer transport system component
VLVATTKGSDDKVVSLTLARKDGSIEWTAEEVRTSELYYDLAWPFHWSSNGKLFYFTHRPARSDGCFGFDDNNGSDLWRVDLLTGQVQEIAPKVGGWLALSPDEKTLAYVSYQPVQIVLRDVASGIERTRTIEIVSQYLDVPTHESHLLWSPDGKALVFTLEINVCNDLESISHSIVRVNADTLIQTTLISEDQRLFTTFEWPTIEQVILEDKDEHRWQMNAFTGKVTKSP